MIIIKIETGTGLQAILVDILKPIKLRKSDSSVPHRAQFEFIGTVDNPIEAIKIYGKGIYECLNILEVF